MSIVAVIDDSKVRRTESTTGWQQLLRFAMLRERRFLLITVALFAAMNMSTVASIRSSYSTPAQIESLRVGAGANPAFAFLLGPLQHSQSTAAMASWRAGLFLVASLALCVAMQAIRLTRKDEELGRVELVRAAPTGRLAGIVVAAVMSVVTALLVAAVIALPLLAFGAEPGDAVALFAQYAATAIAAGGIGLVMAQIAKTAHIANLSAAALLLGGYLLRGIGDATGSGWHWLRVLTPIGWAQLTDPFGSNTIWWALASLALAAACVVLAVALSVRRDLGAGLLAPRAGPASTDGLDTIGRVSARLSLPLLGSWTAGVAAYGLVVGFMQPSVDQIAKGNDLVEKFLRSNGTHASLGVLFGSTMMTFLAVAATGWTASLMTRSRAEESSGRTEVVLATPLDRRRYYLSQLIVGCVGAVVVLLGAAIAMTIGAVLAGSSMSTVADGTFKAAAVLTPACLVISAAVVAMYGTSARLAPLGWLVVSIAFACGPLSELFGLPTWLRDISPFSHVPTVPIEPVTWTPLVVMLVLAIGVAAVGMARFRVRDVG